MTLEKRSARQSAPLYTPEQRQRRDETRWTIVQGLLAPLQFLVFLISLVLVVNYLINGTGLEAATASVVIKTAVLLAIMVTGAIWEKVVFGQYLFAPAFFWEDVVSFGVIALHISYVLCWLAGYGTPQQQMWIALAAYASYVINAAQFLLKLQAARRDEPTDSHSMDLQGALK
ncbi:2-vinyl bacteriochlorophyllide hydratase [Congregibacter variabilis]|uniref:2-vinyl bacteriochlorophyllide hydratase n=1 Tax=Congregibacter variabilis TaxID=3081200 RepID=A0ABZ0I3A6_9GAMM|nr:2-vinyl bacteriochlorophyllide hydratase [Congregibacter sp. IMCC43200]